MNETQKLIAKSIKHHRFCINQLKEQIINADEHEKGDIAMVIYHKRHIETKPIKCILEEIKITGNSRLNYFFRVIQKGHILFNVRFCVRDIKKIKGWINER